MKKSSYSSVTFLIYIVFLFLVPKISLSETQNIKLSDENEYIYSFGLIEGYEITNALVIYKYDELWYYPLIEIASRLGLKFSYSSVLKKVEGKLISENSFLNIDLDKCLVESNLYKKKYDCQNVVEYLDEVYITKKVLEQWLPLIIVNEELKSKLLLKKYDDFPLVKKIKREREAKAIGKNTRKKTDYGYPVELRKNGNIDGYFLDQKFSTEYSKSKISSQRRFNYQTDLSLSLLNFETTFYVNGDSDELKDYYLNFKKVYHEDESFYSIKEIQGNDVLIPSTELVGGGERVKGAYVTNVSNSKPLNYGTHEFEGKLLDGWEVELYQNNILIARKESDKTGRYKFEEIPLYYGNNRFKLIYYGPQGEERIEYKKFNIRENLINNNKLYYKAGVGQNDDKQIISNVQISKKVAKSLSADLCLNRLVLKNETKASHYITASLNHFGDNYLFTGLMSKNSEGKNAYKFLTSFPFDYFNFSLDHSIVQGYRSAKFNKDVDGDKLKDTSKAILGIPIPFKVPINTQTTITNKNFENDEQDELEGKNRWQFNLGKFSFNNEYEWVFNKDVPWKNKTTFRYRFFNVLARFVIALDEVKGISSLKNDIRSRIDKKTDLSFSYNHSFLTNIKTYNFSFSKSFSKLTSSLKSSYSTDGRWTLGFDFNFGFDIDFEHNNFEMSGEALTQSGSASVVVFLDENHNQVKDEYEKKLAGIKVRAIQTNEEKISDINGYVHFNKLPVNQPVDISLVETSIENIELRPIKKGIRFYPTAGSPNRLYLPIGTFWDVDGSVVVKRGDFSKPQKYLKIKLINHESKKISEVETDFDGFFIFEKIISGKYTLEVSVTVNGETFVKTKDISLGTEGGYLGDNDFLFEFNK